MTFYHTRNTVNLNDVTYPRDIHPLSAAQRDGFVQPFMANQCIYTAKNCGQIMVRN